jgi:hypothetical protein
VEEGNGAQERIRDSENDFPEGVGREKLGRRGVRLKISRFASMDWNGVGPISGLGFWSARVRGEKGPFGDGPSDR